MQQSKLFLKSSNLTDNKSLLMYNIFLFFYYFYCDLLTAKSTILRILFFLLINTMSYLHSGTRSSFAENLMRLNLLDGCWFVHIQFGRILPRLLLGRLAFVPDGVSKSMADSRLKSPQLRLGHLRVGELQTLFPMFGTRPCCLVQAITQHTCPDPDMDS